MANVHFLSLCVFAYFTFVPVVFILQLFILKLIQWAIPHTKITNPKLFDFCVPQVYFLVGVGLVLVFFAKAAKEDFPFSIFFVYLNVFSFLLLLTVFNFFAKQRCSQFELDTLLTVSIWLLFSLSTFCFCTNFIIFLFNIELIATVYFFFFLFYITKDSTTVIKFKNLLSNYLFVSFFTVCGFSIALFFIVSYVGTTDFGELNASAKGIPFFVWNILLLALLTKLGGPGVFFFKVEIYKVLSLYSVVFFSICSFFINSVIILFLFKTCVAFYTSNSFLILAGLLVSNLMVLARGFQLVSFCQFLGLSAVNTWGLLMVFFLINDSKFFYPRIVLYRTFSWNPK